MEGVVAWWLGLVWFVWSGLVWFGFGISFGYVVGWVWVALGLVAFGLFGWLVALNLGSGLDQLDWVWFGWLVVYWLYSAWIRLDFSVSWLITYLVVQLVVAGPGGLIEPETSEQSRCLDYVCRMTCVRLKRKTTMGPQFLLAV